MKGLFKLEVNFPYASLYGLFVADTEQIECLKKNRIEVYWGEVCGKHSEECGPIYDNEITLVTTEEDVIKVIQDNGLEFGFNPLEENYGGGVDNLPESEEFDWEDCSVEAVIEYLLTGKISK